jgi:hypothetical protein
MSSHSNDPHAEHGDATAPTPHDPPDPHDAHNAPDAHGGHDDHGAVEPVPEAPPPPLSVLVWPVIILLIVALLVLPMAARAFAPYNASPPAEPGNEPGLVTSPGTEAPLPTSTPASSGTEQSVVLPQPATATTAPPAMTQPPLTATEAPPAPPDTVAPPTEAPATAVAPLYNAGEDALRSLTLGDQTYQVEATDTVMDWKFSNQPGVASWVSGTIFPYVVGVPSSAANDSLLKSLKPNDQIRLTVASGAVRTFQVTSVQRVPTTDVGVLSQNHPGVAVLLLGESGTDRLTVLGDFLPQS